MAQGEEWTEADREKYSNVYWDYEPSVSKPKKVRNALQAKYINRAEKNKVRNAERQGRKFPVPRKPRSKRGLTIKNGINPADTVTIGISIWDGRKWIKWKFGWEPEVSAKYARFNFMNGEKRKLQYANVWQYLQDHYVGREEPIEGEYEGHNCKYFIVPFPALEAYDRANSGDGEIA